MSGAPQATTGQVADSIEVPALGDALQLVLAGVLEREPATGRRSFTVWETSTSDGPASAPIRAPIRHGDAADLPVDRLDLAGVHARADLDAERRDRRRRSPSAQRTARAGPSNVAKNPSPAVSTSVPRNRPSSARTTPVVLARRARPSALSPSSAAFSVEPTMSVNITVASTRSRSASSPRTSATKRSISSSERVLFTDRRGSARHPGARRTARPGIRSAISRLLDREVEVAFPGEHERRHVDRRRSACVALIPRFIRSSAIAAPGLADFRMYDASHATSRSSSSVPARPRLGDSCRASSRSPHVSSMRARYPSWSCLYAGSDA